MSIIGISGKIGSGKDTVGLIIQYLIANSKHPQDKPSFNILQQDKFQQQNAELISNYNIKKFADKLKDIVCLLINCTREQLEDAEFKNKELGEEWWFNHIVPEHGFGSKLINWDKDLKPQKLTPRLLLQLLGTECGRDIIHPNIWVNALFADYKRPSHWENRYYDEINKKGLAGKEEVWGEYPNWIITDMRFPNELKAVKDRGGISIRVNRTSNSCVCVDDSYLDCLVQCNRKQKEHDSETALDKAEFDYVIYNTGSIENLVEEVRGLLIQEKLL